MMCNAWAPGPGSWSQTPPKPGFRVEDLGFRVEDLRYRVED